MNNIEPETNPVNETDNSVSETSATSTVEEMEEFVPKASESSSTETSGRSTAEAKEEPIKSTPKAEAKKTAEPQGLSESEVAQILIDLSEAQERAAKLDMERKHLYDTVVRRQAEFENFRKRVDRERTEMHAKARADVVTQLLSVLDNLERALGSADQAESDESIRISIITGVKLIHRQFLDVMLGLGLTPVKTVGEAFDPHVHEAVTTEASSELPENTIIAELQKGYKLGDRLLRPSMVKVAIRE